MQDELRAWLIESGYPTVVDLARMTGGLGGNEMWTFAPAPDTSPLVARIFREGGFAAADREALAMDAAADHGIPVPSAITRGTIANRPVLVTPFIAGVPAGHVIAADPGHAHAVGLTMGETLGRLHEITAPQGLAHPGAWLDRGGPALAPLRHLLESVPNQHRLLHLDYHPLNVMMHEGILTGVIDWENAQPGPPHMDLARSRAMLRAIFIGNLSPGIDPGVFTQYEQGLVEGHTRVIGDDPHPALSAAWGMGMTADDLSRQVGKPGGGITSELVAQLATERDALIAGVLT